MSTQKITAGKSCLLFAVLLSLAFIPFYTTAHAQYTCGDLNDDGIMNIQDVVSILNYLYNGYPLEVPPEFADLDDVAGINSNDYHLLVDHLFLLSETPYCQPVQDTVLPVTDDSLIVLGGQIPPGAAICEVQLRFKAISQTYGLAMPLAFTCLTSDVSCDSVVFAADISPGFEFLTDVIDNELGKVAIDVGDITLGIGPGPEDYHIASLWFTTATVDPVNPQTIVLDTTQFMPSNIVIFSRDVGDHIAYIPTFVFIPDTVINTDIDDDGVFDAYDNCPLIPNSDQLDNDDDGLGNACDNCPDTPGENQDDFDSDGLGDICDLCPNDPINDIDGDDVCGDVDNCPTVFNPSQLDSDEDGIGDACDTPGEFECGDNNADGWINVADVVYLINFIFKDGPRPCLPD